MEQASSLLASFFGRPWPPDHANETAAPSAKGHGSDQHSDIEQRHRYHYGNIDPSDFDDLLGPTSPLDKPIHVTRFPTQAASRKADHRLSLRDLARVVGSESGRTKAELPWFKLARFGDQRTDKNCLRNNANVQAVSGVEADYDGGEISPLEAEGRLQAANIAALIYTTPSHRPEAPRWRLFVPFAEEQAPDHRERFMMRLNGLFDGALDGASFTLSQAYYGGNVEGQPPIETRLVDGRHIDRADDLDATALPKGKRRKADEEAEHADDASASGELYRLACRLKAGGDDKAGFELSVAGNPKAQSHVDKEEKVAKGRGQRAIDRAWKRAPSPEPIEFDNLDAIDPASAPKPSRLTFLTPDQCGDAPSRGYIVKGLIAPRDVGCIFGAPGAGKSLIAPYLSFKVAQGERAFGMRTKAGGVFYVAAEDPHGMRGRVTALRLTHGHADGFTLVEGVSNLLAKDSPDLAALRTAAAERRPALIIIDTLAMAFPGLEENAAEGMGRVVAVARSLTKHGAAVILIHHSTKDSNGTPRGHSLLNGALDFAIELQARDESGIIRGRLTKNRNGPCDLDLAFRIGTVDMGTDDDGDPISIARCDEVEAGSAPKPIKLNPREREALRILRDKAGHVPDESQGVPLDEWRASCRSSPKICASENPETCRKAVQRAFEGLFRSGIVYRVGEAVFIDDPHAIPDGDFDDLEADQ
ncbi:AAA family ATPase [Bosea sp. (in: a-proteobacteria)]|uniref:AAA family ATPase n=1 Tax=Bosea sp. (in: a-proteobacteria) TaxID=1871050 RepID=UPI0027323DC6|nr:AAA family ATPase [Bosea sp. (in: a-proteobacteria)]MDP3409036.1 AAA family ATPase [Bosea sp. (in: a-proteobacteria)]